MDNEIIKELTDLDIDKIELIRKVLKEDFSIKSAYYTRLDGMAEK